MMSDDEKNGRERAVLVVASRTGLIDMLSSVRTGRFKQVMGPPWPWDPYGDAYAWLDKNIARAAQSEADPAELFLRLSKGLDLGVPIALYEPSAAAELFRFDVGHRPKDGSLYVQHPVFPDRYIAPEDFARTLAHEREAALRQLAAALGVKELWLSDAKVLTKKGLFNTTVSVPDAATEVGIKVTFDKQGNLVKKLYSRFGQPRGEPHVPSDLQRWVDWDPEFRTMARGRLEGHLLEQEITVEFKQTSDLGGEVSAKIAGRGFTAGGAFSTMSHSVWTFKAEYWPLS